MNKLIIIKILTNTNRINILLYIRFFKMNVGYLMIVIYWPVIKKLQDIF